MSKHSLVVPTMDEEERLHKQGYATVAGLDEVGRGCLAGPVVAAAIILPENAHKKESLHDVRDSKMLSPFQRERMYEALIHETVSIGIGIISSEEIERINILQATKQAMIQAISQLDTSPHALVIDAVHLPTSIHQHVMIRGDVFCFSIAAASIIAKVTRDHIMQQYDTQYPQYGFSAHKGYGTQQHIRALQQYGITPLHRKTFAPVRMVLQAQRELVSYPYIPEGYIT